MSYYSFFICLLISIFSFQTKQFVSFDASGITKSQEHQIVTVTLPFEILEGYHIQTELESNTDFIRTELIFEDSDLFEVVNYEFAIKENKTIVLDQHPHDVLSNKFVVTVVLKLNKNVILSDFKLKGQLYYQACDNRQCFFPRTLTF